MNELVSAFHIERANGKVNGDVVAVEPAKTVNQDAADDEVEIKLNVDNYQMLRSDSQGSLNSHGRSNSRLGRLFRSKHEMKKRETRADENRGEIEIQIDFDDLVNQLKIALIRCRDLMTFDKKDQCNPYVSVKLVALDGNKEVFKKKTPTAKNTRHPHFDNHVEIDINPSDLLNHKVVINVKDDTNYGTFVAKPVLGCLEIRLDSLMNRQLSQRWIPLSVERK
eukprot:NP_741182.1 Extended SYnapTotagmin homolog [Caenorhabditis elegans]